MGKVQNIRVTSIEATSASFAWEAPDCEYQNGQYEGFKYMLRKADDTFTLIAARTINSTSVTLTDLVPYTKYQLQVAFMNHVDEGPISDPEKFTTLEGREW